MGHSRHKPGEAGTIPPVTYVHRERTNTTGHDPAGPGRSITINSSQTALSSYSTAGTSTTYPLEPSARQSRFVVSCCRGRQQWRCIVSATTIFTRFTLPSELLRAPFRCAPETNARLPFDGDRAITIAPVGVAVQHLPAAARTPVRPRARAPHARRAVRSDGRQDVGPTDLI